MMIEHEDEETTKNPPPLNLETDLCAGGQVFELQSEDGLSLEFFAELQAEELSREAERAEVVDLTLELALEGAADEEVSEESVEDEVKDGTLGISEELTLYGKIEAVLFASPKPLRSVEVHDLVMDQGYTLKETQDALDELMEFYRDRAGGFHLKYVKRMGYQFQTTSAAKALMERQFSSRPRPLSRASLETLAVIAYRQKSNKAGVTRAEVEFIRGVDAGSIFKTLVERKLLACVGRKEIPGRPMIFGITDEFLKVFQLGSINDLPPLESFQTPGDVINAANEKIAKFEAEEDGVNPESFVGDEAYTDSLGTSDADILGDDASGLTPSVRTSVRTIDIEALESHPSDHIPSEIMAEMVADAFDDATDDERSAERQAAQEIAIPAAIIEEMAADLMDRLEEGEIAFPILDVIERSIEGASSVAGEHATEAETGFVSDCDDHVSKSRHENV